MLRFSISLQKSFPSLSKQTINTRRNMSYIVDVWAQPPDPDFLKTVPEVERLMKISNSDVFKMVDRQVGPPEIVEMMDKQKVTKALLAAWARPGKFAVTNEAVKKYVDAYPERIIGLGTVNLTNPMEAVKQVELCIKEYNFKGIRILPWLWNMPPTTNYFYPVFAKCVELDVPFCTQVGHTGPLCPSEPGRPIPYIDQVALDFPELKIVCGHIGYPWTDEMIGCAWKHANVYIDTSAYAPNYYPKSLVHFMNSYGKKKVMFGTNFPHLSWDVCVEQLKDLPLSEDAKACFLWKNANRVFKLGMDKTGEAASKL